MPDVRSYPLTWPIRIPRTAEYHRKEARFGRMVDQTRRRADGTHSSYKSKKKWTFAMARDDLLAELERLGVVEAVISTDMPLRLDGLPKGNARDPEDPGVAVYFKRRIVAAGGRAGEVRSYTMTCDQYDRLADNTRALVLTIESLRRIERHGSSDLMEQAFSGFTALPPARTGVRPWRDVLGFVGDVTREAVEFRYKKLLLVHHPDRGGTHEQMAEINDAIDRAREELAC